MFDQFKYRRELKQEVRDINRKYRRLLKSAESNENKSALVEYDRNIELALIQKETDSLETLNYEEQSFKYNIDIPDEWYFKPHELDQLSAKVLSAVGKNKLGHMIRDARRENIRFWLSVILPVLSVLIGLAGAVIGILAFLRK